MRVRSKPPIPKLQRSELEAITRTAHLPMMRIDDRTAAYICYGNSRPELLFASGDERSFRELWRQAEATRKVVTG